jgi:dUTPase
LIDPLYRGNLLVGLYNFSSTRRPLQAGKKLVAVVFYRLLPTETAEFVRPEEIDDFPDALVRVMRNYTPATV